MLVIRQEQWAALAEPGKQRYEQKLVDYLCESRPAIAERLGDEGLRQLVGRAIASSASYGIDSERDVALYLGLTLALGDDFDRSEKTPWAQPILNDQRSDGSTRMKRLCKRAEHYLDQQKAKVKGRDHV